MKFARLLNFLLASLLLILLELLRIQQLTADPQVSIAQAAGSLSTGCNGTPNASLPGDLISFHFNSLSECQKFEDDCAHGNCEQSKSLVGTKDACSPPLGHGRATCQMGLTSCNSGNKGNCAVAANIPNCSVAQLDCSFNGSWGGTIGVNCNGCVAPATPTPTPTSTPSPTPQPTATPTPTSAPPTPTPTATPTATPTPTPTPTATPTGTPTPTPTPTPVVPQVLAATAPPTLPKTGNESLAFLAIPGSLSILGFYLRKKFKLI